MLNLLLHHLDCSAAMRHLCRPALQHCGTVATCLSQVLDLTGLGHRGLFLAATCLQVPHRAFNAFQTSSDHQADRIRVAALTLAVNLVVGIALVPTFGLAGALGSLAITRFAAVYFSWRFAVKGRAIKMPVTSMSRVLISAVYAGVAAQLFEIVVPGRYSFIVAGVIFFVVYVAESVVLGAWKQSDFDLIAEVLSQFGGRGRSAASWIQTTASRYAAGNGPEQPGRRELVGRVAQSLGIPRIAGTIRSQLRSDFRVLAYHRILPELDDATFRFDTELVSARKEEFEWQMAYVARRFRLVSCQDVADAIAKDRPLPKRAVMVTFDDGFHDNYSVAFPVLRRLGVPATFFLSTGYIGTNRMFWFDWVVHALMCTPLTEVALVSLNTTLDLRAGDAARRAAARKLLLLLKRTSESTRQKTIVELQQIVRIENSAAEGAQNAPMTWGQVREMSAAGMEFGSHTVSHPILSTIGDPIRLRDELQSSKTIIEQETGRTVLSLAYPVGGPDALNAEVVQATADAGYRFAFTYQPGVNRLSMEKRFHLKRLQVERYTTRDMFSAAIELPEIFA